MAIVDGNLITVADLNTIWTPVTTVYSAMSLFHEYEVNTTTFFFDGLDSVWYPLPTSLIPTSPAIARWIPSTDAYIVGITTIIGSGTESGTATCSLTGNINQPLAWTATGTSGSTVRTQTTIPDGVFGVLAGDPFLLQLTALTGYTAGTALCRVHIVTKSRWSRL